jgi:hypothetical protein
MPYISIFVESSYEVIFFALHFKFLVCIIIGWYITSTDLFSPGSQDTSGLLRVLLIWSCERYSKSCHAAQQQRQPAPGHGCVSHHYHPPFLEGDCVQLEQTDPNSWYSKEQNNETKWTGQKMCTPFVYTSKAICLWFCILCDGIHLFSVLLVMLWVSETI